MFIVQCGSEYKVCSTGEIEVQNDRKAGAHAEWGLPPYLQQCTEMSRAKHPHTLTAEWRVIYGEECRRTPVAKAYICERRAGFQNARVSLGAHTPPRNCVTDERRMRCGCDEQRTVSSSSCLESGC